MAELKPSWYEIYPLTIVADRYSGTYSGGIFTAWNLYFDELPNEIDGGDVECMDFWYGENGDIYGDRRKDIVCGVGSTPNNAVSDLYMKLKKQEDKP